jgi:hypothetical protein
VVPVAGASMGGEVVGGQVVLAGPLLLVLDRVVSRCLRCWGEYAHTFAILGWSSSTIIAAYIAKDAAASVEVGSAVLAQLPAQQL